MSIADVLPSIRTLSRTDQLRLMEILATDLGESLEPPIIQPNREYEIWSPFDAYQAAATMLRVLEETKAT